jgi:hypothetical protein
MIRALVIAILGSAAAAGERLGGTDLLTPVVYVSQRNAVWVGLRNDSDVVQFVCINSVALSVSRDGGVAGSGASRSPHECNSIEDSFAISPAGILAVSIPRTYFHREAECRVAIAATVAGNQPIDKHGVCAAIPVLSWTRDPAALSVEPGADNKGTTIRNLSNSGTAVALRRGQGCSESSVLLLPHSSVRLGPARSGKTSRKDYVLVDAKNRCRP